MTNLLRIGTRKSELALWQANNVNDRLKELGQKAEIKPIVSMGDTVLDKPLYALNVTGIFTRRLDVALLTEEIDIAVHSLKDVPTILPKGLVQAAVLKRANAYDILVHKGCTEFLSHGEAVIATGSLRRRAAWRHKYPHHKLVGLRGNVNSRLQKLIDNTWNGAIFAAAGLARIDILPDTHTVLDWMVPAPAQGAIMIMCREDDVKTLEVCRHLNDKNTNSCTKIEREFLNKLEGGCTAPIGAYATIKNDNVYFDGVLYSLDGQTKIHVSRVMKLKDKEHIADKCVQEVFAKGGRAVMKENALRVAQSQNITKRVRKIHVFSTKILSSEYTRNLDRNFVYNEANFINVEFCKLSPEYLNVKNVIFTSQNGVRAIHESLGQGKSSFENIFCVGNRTKILAEHFFGSIAHTENSASALAKHIVDNLADMYFTFFCADNRLDVLPKYLLKNQVRCTEITAYKTRYNSAHIASKVDCILFFSPSAIKSYLMENAPDPIAFCIGDTTALEAQKHFKQVETAPSPSVQNIIKLVNKYYE